MNGKHYNSQPRSVKPYHEKEAVTWHIPRGTEAAQTALLRGTRLQVPNQETVTVLPPSQTLLQDLVNACWFCFLTTRNFYKPSNQALELFDLLRLLSTPALPTSHCKSGVLPLLSLTSLPVGLKALTSCVLGPSDHVQHESSWFQNSQWPPCRWMCSSLRDLLSSISIVTLPSGQFWLLSLSSTSATFVSSLLPRCPQAFA